MIVGAVLWRRLVAPLGFRCFRVALRVRGQRPKGRCPVMKRSADRTMKGMKGSGSVCRAWSLGAPGGRGG